MSGLGEQDNVITTSAAVALTTAAVHDTFRMSRPFLLLRWGVIVSGVVTTTAKTLKLTHMFDELAVVPAWISPLTLTLGAVNEGFYVEGEEFPNGTHLQVNPGEYLEAEAISTDVASGYFFYECVLLPFQDVRFDRPGAALTTPSDVTFDTTLAHTIKLGA